MSVYEAWLQTGGVEGDLMGFINYLSSKGYTMDTPNVTSWAVKNGFPASTAQPTTGNAASGFDKTAPSGEKISASAKNWSLIPDPNEPPEGPQVLNPKTGVWERQVKWDSLLRNPTGGEQSAVTAGTDQLTPRQPAANVSSVTGLPLNPSSTDTGGYYGGTQGTDPTWSEFGTGLPSKGVYFGADIPGVHAGPAAYMEKGLQESGFTGGPFTGFMRSQMGRSQMQWEIAKLMANVTGQPADLGVLAKVMRGETVYGPDAIQQIVNFAQNDPQGKEMFNTPSGSKLLYYMLGSTRGPVTSAYDRFMQSRYEPGYNLYKGNAYDNPTQPYADYLKRSGYWG